MQTAMSTLQKVRSNGLLSACHLLVLMGCTSGRISQTQNHATLAKKGTMMNATATITSEILKEHIHIHLILHNTSDQVSLEVEKRQLFQSELSLGSLVDLNCEGKPVPFIGSMAKVHSATGAGVIHLLPGASALGDADITKLFAFLPGKHSYQISYHAFVSVLGEDDKLLEIKSEPAIFVFEPMLAR